MRTTVALVMLVMLGTCSCGKSVAPTAPTPASASASPAAPSPAPEADFGSAGIRSFSMAGQLIQGGYHYRPVVLIAAGREAIVLKSLVFLMPGAGMKSEGHVRMNVTVRAGDTRQFDYEIPAAAAGTHATVTLTYTTTDGQSHEAVATTAIPPINEVPSDAVVHVSSVVTRWFHAGWWNYWPRLTVSETTGRGDVTITRLEFMLLDMGIHGRVPPIWDAWNVPAGGAVELFTEWFYGEPKFYLSSTRKTDRVMVTVSYVDEAGRPGDVTATAHVSGDDSYPQPLR